MAHELEIRDGVASMMYAGAAPWHGLGQAVEKEVTAAAAMRLAGLDWKLEKRPLYIEGLNRVDGIPVIGQEAPNHVAVVRICDNKVIGVVGSRYEIIDNTACFDFLDEVVGSGQAVYHTAGSIKGGAQVFVTIKLPGSALVGKDKIDKFILLTTSHDGSLKLNVRWTPIRVVCNNTMMAALSRGASDSVTIMHTRNYRTKIEQARQVLDLTNEYYRIMEVEYNKLVEAPFNTNQLKVFVSELIPASKTDDAGKPVVSKLIERKRDEVIWLAKNGTGIKPYVGTKWAAFNAVTEWIDHTRNVRNVQGSGVSKAESRMTSILGHAYGELRQRAYNLLQEV